MLSQALTAPDDRAGFVLDLSVKKGQTVLLSPPSSTTSSSSSSSLFSPQHMLPSGKRMLEMNNNAVHSSTLKVQQTNKRPLRFQCKHCDYKAPSTSLMQNHIYRHTDSTPYACAYCGHKSTTKSTIMVHIELCHPHMEVKIIENRVREQDFYRDLNSTEAKSSPGLVPEPRVKKPRRSNQYDSESAPINGVAISLKALVDDATEFSPGSDELYEAENLEPILLPTSDFLFDENEQPTETSFSDSTLSLKLKFSPATTPTADASASVAKGSDSDDDSEYLLVYNRPKQYYGSLYEPDKQYACQLCSYTTNHRPSMEDHVFVHTNEKPYKCGYCGEEIYTRYAATYHIKYKHTGMPRNFIQNKADITQYYVNRAKKEEEKNQFKLVDTRRVKVPVRNGKSVHNQQNKMEPSGERPIQLVPSPPAPSPLHSSPSPLIQLPASQPTSPDYRFLLAWSYYLATQAAWLSPMMQQQGQSPLPMPTDPEAAAKFMQTIQSAMHPLAAEQSKHEPKRLIIKDEENE